MKTILVYFYLQDLTEQSTNSIVRLTASLMKGLDDKAIFHHFFEKEDKLKLNNGYPHFLNISYKMRLKRKLNNLLGRKRIGWFQIKDHAVRKWAANLSDKNFDAIILMELDKVKTVKKLFPDSKIIYWIHSVSALCKPDYLKNIEWVDYFISPSKTTYHFLLERLRPQPLTALFSFMPNWCENIFFKRDRHYISFLKLQYCIPEKEKVFIFCGGKQKLKGAFLIEAIIAKLASQTNEKLVFIFCGLGSKVGTETKGNIRIMNMGTVNPKGLIDLYSVADYGLHPSLAYDHCPVTLLEMISCSVLPVVSDIGGIKEIVGDDYSCLIKEPNDVNAWVYKILEIITMDVDEKNQLMTTLQDRIGPVYNRRRAITVMKEIIEG